MNTECYPCSVNSLRWYPWKVALKSQFIFLCQWDSWPDAKYFQAFETCQIWALQWNEWNNRIWWIVFYCKSQHDKALLLKLTLSLIQNSVISFQLLSFAYFQMHTMDHQSAPRGSQPKQCQVKSCVLSTLWGCCVQLPNWHIELQPTS